MAKAVSTDDAVLAGLRKALAALPAALPLSGTGGIFPGGAKGQPLVDAAISQGVLTEKIETIKSAKTTKTIVRGVITDKGRQRVLDADSPKAVLESLLPTVQSLAEVRQDRPNAEAYRADLEKATRACTASIEAAFARLQDTVTAAMAKMEEAIVKAVTTAQPPVPADLTSLVSTLQATLARVNAGAASTVPVVPPAPTTPPLPPPMTTTSPVPVPPAEARPHQTPTLTAGDLRRAIRDAYDHLCLFKEFRDRLVEIPRLYHETASRFPGLQVEQFHRELETLSRERKVELHKLNEVHQAKERHLAITKDDRLFYYLIWE